MTRFADALTALSPLDWAWFFGVWIGVTLVLWLVVRVVGGRASNFFRRTSTKLDDYLADLLSATRWFFLLAIGLYAAVLTLEVTPLVQLRITQLAFLALVVQGVIWFNRILARYIEQTTHARVEEDPGAVTTVQAVGFVGRLVAYSVALLLALSNLGFEVGPLVASLGIGGIAVALALQNVLGDLFASLSIVLDKPFVVGDFLIVGDFLGSVEKVGLKTTRLRSLSGEQLVFSNSDLLASRIRNYKRMQERRVVFGFGVTYQTSADDLEALAPLARSIVEAQPNVRFDRSHFKAFGASSLDFEVVYYVLSADYAEYMDVQQAINLALFRSLEQRGIEFAYPTQTLHVAGPLTVRTAGPASPANSA
jgi:small-conductance mechanosensitive channel